MGRNLRMFSVRAAVLIALTVFIFQAWSFSQDKVAQIDELMKLYQEYEGFNGTVLVAESGKVIFKKGYGMDFSLNRIRWHTLLKGLMISVLEVKVLT